MVAPLNLKERDAGTMWQDTRSRQSHHINQKGVGWFGVCWDPGTGRANMTEQGPLQNKHHEKSKANLMVHHFGMPKNLPHI